MQIWDCQYGFGKNYPNYFSVFPLNNAPYTAAYEEMEVYAGLSEYLIQSEAIELLPSLKILIPEFLKYAVSRLPYYYPTKLPEDMISEEVKTGEIVQELWIPVEDLYNGWEKSGQVGQEVYGAGVGFGVLTRQYHKVKEEEFLLFSDYPITNLKKSKKTLTFTVLGTHIFECNLKVIFPQKLKLQIEIIADKNSINASEIKAEQISNKIAGGSRVKMTW